jgi:hypothetical protein
MDRRHLTDPAPARLSSSAEGDAASLCRATLEPAASTPITLHDDSDLNIGMHGRVGCLQLQYTGHCAGCLQHLPLRTFFLPAVGIQQWPGMQIWGEVRRRALGASGLGAARV